jgi:YggT family protein
MAGYLVRFVELLFTIMTFAILARVLMSWFPASAGSKLATVLYDVTEPVLGPIRKIVPPIGMLDLSPFIAMVLLQLLQVFILSLFTPYYR